METRMNGQKIHDLITKHAGEEALDPDLKTRFLQDVIINAKLWMTFLDPAGNVLIWNLAAEEITGYGGREVLGRSEVWKWLYPDPRYRAKVTGTIVERIRNHRHLENLETVIRTRSGEERRISWNTRGLAGPDGAPMGYVLLGNDITELAQVKAALREREAVYRNVVNTQKEFISRFRPDGTHIFVNDAYCRYFGMTCSLILGRRFRPDIPEEDREQVRQFFASLTPERPTGMIEHRIRMPDGEIRWQQWNEEAIFDPDGTLVEYQSVGRDITELKHAEAAARESNERSVRFIKEAAMRLKTPVELVRENIGLLLEDLEAGDVDQQQLLLRLSIQMKSMEQIQVNLRDLNRAIVGQVADLSPASRRFLTE